MILAVLSCVFVMYLYYTLNQETHSAQFDANTRSTNPAGGATADEQSRSMLAQLEALDTRLARIQQQGGSEENQ